MIENGPPDTRRVSRLSPLEPGRAGRGEYRHRLARVYLALHPHCQPGPVEPAQDTSDAAGRHPARDGELRHPHPAVPGIRQVLQCQVVTEPETVLGAMPALTARGTAITTRMSAEYAAFSASLNCACTPCGPFLASVAPAHLVTRRAAHRVGTAARQRPGLIRGEGPAAAAHSPERGSGNRPPRRGGGAFGPPAPTPPGSRPFAGTPDPPRFMMSGAPAAAGPRRARASPACRGQSRLGPAMTPT
jgi:hypothetical protein